MILVTGGTGFIGRALVRQLVTMGKPTRILLRPSKSSPSLPRGIPVEVAVASLQDERGIRAAMKGVQAVYHLAGAERASSRADFNSVDIEGTQSVAKAAADAGVERLVFLSHLGADKESAYTVLKAKGLAENAILQSKVPYTVLRSAPVYGPGDQFTIGLLKILKSSPGIFLLPGDGTSRIQPLWLDDLITCLTMVLGDVESVNQTYEIGGPEALTFREVMETIMSVTGIQRMLLPIAHVPLGRIALFLEQMGQFPLPLYWLEYLVVDHLCPADFLPRRFNILPARFHQKLGYLKS